MKKIMQGFYLPVSILKKYLSFWMCVVPFSDTVSYFVSPEKALLGMASEGGSASQGLGAQGGLAVDGQWGLHPHRSHWEKGQGSLHPNSSLAWTGLLVIGNYAHWVAWPFSFALSSSDPSNNHLARSLPLSGFFFSW